MLVHLTVWWHFKVLEESGALAAQVSWTVLTFAADKCWICEDCETADWYYKWTATRIKLVENSDKRKKFTVKKSSPKVNYSPSCLTFFDWLWDLIFYSLGFHQISLRRGMSLNFLVKFSLGWYSLSIAQQGSYLYIVWQLRFLSKATRDTCSVCWKT